MLYKLYCWVLCNLASNLVELVWLILNDGLGVRGEGHPSYQREDPSTTPTVLSHLSCLS